MTSSAVPRSPSAWRRKPKTGAPRSAWRSLQRLRVAPAQARREAAVGAARRPGRGADPRQAGAEQSGSGHGRTYGRHVWMTNRPDPPLRSPPERNHSQEALVKRTLIVLGQRRRRARAAPAASAEVGLSGGTTTLRLTSARPRRSAGSASRSPGRPRTRRAAASGSRSPAAASTPHRGRDDRPHRRPAFLGRRRSDHPARSRVAVGRKIMLSARVGAGRVHILELSGARGEPLRLQHERLRAARPADPKAATALNGTFGVTAFKKGLRLGTVSVRSRTDEAEILARARPRSRSIPGRSRRSTSLGITPGVIAPRHARRARPPASRSRAAGPSST